MLMVLMVLVMLMVVMVVIHSLSLPFHSLSLPFILPFYSLSFPFHLSFHSLSLFPFVLVLVERSSPFSPSLSPASPSQSFLASSPFEVVEDCWGIPG